MKKFNAVLIAVLFAVIAVLSAFLAACTPSEPSDPNNRPDRDVCDHSLTQVAAVRETCTTDGNLQYWFCSKCGKYFADGNAAEEIDENNTTIAAHHTLTHESGEKATCTTDGNIDYFHCSVCGENFLDETCKNKVDLDATVIASTGHVLGDEWQHDEIGHWKVCGACEQQVAYSAHNFQDYVCQDCGAVDEVNRPLTDKEITEKITDILKENILNLLRPDSIVNYLALNPAIVDGQYKVQILIDYLSSMSGKEEEYFSFVELPITQEFTLENVKKGLCQPTAKRTGKKLITFKKTTDDPRGIDILKKIDPDGDHDHYDFVSVKIDSGTILPTLGPTNAILVYGISENGIKYLCVNAQRDVDPIGNSILNGTENKTYVINYSSKVYEFTNSVIYDFNGLL